MQWRDSLLIRLEPFRRHLAVWRAAYSYESELPPPPGWRRSETAFLPAVDEIIATPPSPLGRTTGWIIMALFSSALAWATLGKVDIHATAQGRIIPGGKTKPVAAIETASVAAIHVKDGDHVSVGQVLIELDPAAPEADVSRLTRERQEEVVTAARLRALLDGRTDFTLSNGFEAPADLIELNRQELRHKLADHRATIEGLGEERRQKEAEKRGLLSDKARLEQTVPLLEERSRVKGKLSEDGYVSRTEYLQVQQDYIDRKQELDGAQHKIAEADSEIANIADKLAQAEAQFRADTLSQLAEADQKAASLEQELAKSTDRQRLYRLTAPVSGVVQQLAAHAPGAVVNQGQPVLMIVPDDEGIAVEAALQNKDAGFVLPGQSVEIKVEAFPFTRYGTIPGEVQVVSSDSVQTGESDPSGRRSGAANNGGEASADQQGPVYSVRIIPKVDHIRSDDRTVALSPGMAVTAEIKTGRRRVIDYLMDPVARYWNESLRER
jgi:hemolysin D